MVRTQRSSIRLPPMKRGQHVGVLAEVDVLPHSLGLRVRGDDQAVGAVVVVPAGDRRHRDDRLEPLDAGGGDLVREGAVVGDAGHADGAGRPVRGDAVAGLVEAAGASVQPVDDRLGAERLDPVADRRATVGVEGADALPEHDRVAARHVVVVERAVGEVGARVQPCAGSPRVGLAPQPRLARARGLSAVLAQELLRQEVEVHRMVDGVAEIAPVGAVFEHHRHLVARGLGLTRAADLNPDPVAPAVSVAVELRLDEHDLLDSLVERELRLGLPVLDLQPRRRRRLIGRGGRRQDPEGAAEDGGDESYRASGGHG